MTANEVEILVARFFGWRRNLIVPNVSWGWGLRYEADMVIVKASGYAVEVEIKVSAADIKRDRAKRYQHTGRMFRELYFAVPHELAQHPDIPGHAGIIDVTSPVKRKLNAGYTITEIVRAAQVNKLVGKVDADMRLKLAELGSMRIWDLKQALARKLAKTGGAA